DFRASAGPPQLHRSFWSAPTLRTLPRSGRSHAPDAPTLRTLRTLHPLSAFHRQHSFANSVASVPAVVNIFINMNMNIIHETKVASKPFAPHDSAPSKFKNPWPEGF